MVKSATPSAPSPLSQRGASPLRFCGCLSAGVASIAVWLLAKSGSLSFLVQPILGHGSPAAYPFSSAANIFAGMLLRSLPALLAVPPQFRPSSYTRATVLALLGLPFTQTRAALLRLGASLLVLLINSQIAVRRRLFKLLAFRSAAARLLIAFGASRSPGRPNYGGSFNLSTSSVAYRVSLAKAGVSDLTGVPWFYGLEANFWGQRHWGTSLPSRSGLARLSRRICGAVSKGIHCAEGRFCLIDCRITSCHTAALSDFSPRGRRRVTHPSPA